MEEPDTIAEIRVHGNHTTPDADILALAGLTAGEPATEARLAEAERRLRASRRFADVDIRRRYRSIANPSEILVILLVDEHDAVGEDNLIPGPVARFRSAVIWLPVLSYADGYGLTYGARLGFAEPFGRLSRLSVPLTWGGERKATVEVERRFDLSRSDLPPEGGSHRSEPQGGSHRSEPEGGSHRSEPRGGSHRTELISRLSAGVSRRVNPHFDVPDARREIAAQVESGLRAWLRAGAAGRVGHVSFGPERAWHQTVGVRLTVDTRADPSFPRNAVLATIGLDHIRFRDGRAARVSADVRGFAAIGGAAVLALRGAIARAGAPLPPSEQMLLGGGGVPAAPFLRGGVPSGTLRGYRAGHRAGDGLALFSAEARVPFTSPLSVGRFGVKAFVDAGTTWDAGARLRDQRFERGVGGGVYFGAAVVTANVDVGWPERGKPRVHVALGVQF